MSLGGKTSEGLSVSIVDRRLEQVQDSLVTLKRLWLGQDTEIIVGSYLYG